MSPNFLPQSKQITYAIDAWIYNKQSKTGVEMYAFHLIQEMKKHALSENERVVLYSPVKLDGPLAELPSGWESRVLAWPFKRGWMRVRVALELLMSKPDVLFVLVQDLPFPIPFLKTKFVETIHDIGFDRVPDVYEASMRNRLRRVLRRAVRYCTRMISVSEFTKQELIATRHVNPDRISVTQLASDRSVFKKLSADIVDPVLKQYRLGQHFFLFVGRLDKKKNIETIIQAFEHFKSSRGIGDPFELVLVGSPGFGFDAMKKRIDLSVFKEQFRLLGYVPDADVAALMNAASAFLFPSWYEGFGIPNLDALACGTPLITSNIPVHHEVAGDAALFVEPNSIEAWAQAMKRIVEDPTFADTLRTKGLVQIEKFSWQKTAEETWKILSSVV